MMDSDQLISQPITVKKVKRRKRSIVRIGASHRAEQFRITSLMGELTQVDIKESHSRYCLPKGSLLEEASPASEGETPQVCINPDYSPRNLIVGKAKWKWERKGTVVP